MLVLTVTAFGADVAPTVLLKMLDEVAYFHRASPSMAQPNVEVERRAVQRTYRALYPSRDRSNRLLGSLAWLREAAVVRFLHVEVLAARNVQYCVRRHDATPPDADQQ